MELQMAVVDQPLLGGSGYKVVDNLDNYIHHLFDQVFETDYFVDVVDVADVVVDSLAGAAIVAAVEPFAGLQTAIVEPH